MSMTDQLKALMPNKSIDGKIRVQQKRLKGLIDYFKHKTVAVVGDRAWEINALGEALKQAEIGLEKGYKLTLYTLKADCLEEQKKLYDAK